ncbi:phasin family protein [Marinivivus vitaminiproducens]|uniref:phasin family protein n=1 Tax=Marinivivus vitaminiproducens TaxID=3035935 RepID=UPI0027A742C2|nr:phasin family protein [Geminicoccaceae bacterium SCSIO 64248]
MATARPRKVADDTAAAVNDAATEATKKTQDAIDQASTMFQDSFSRFQDMFGQYKGFAPATPEFLSDTRKAVQEGVIEFNTEVLSFTQGAVNEAFETSKAVLAASSVQEAVNLQSAYLKGFMQSSVEEAKKLSELAATTSQEAFKPLQKGFSEAAAKATKTA